MQIGLSIPLFIWVVIITMLLLGMLFSGWVCHPISKTTKRALNLSRDGVIILNKKGGVIFMNKVAERLLGQTSQQVQNMNIAAIHEEIGAKAALSIEAQRSKFIFLTINEVSLYVKVYVGKSAKDWWLNHGFRWENSYVVELEDVTEYLYAKKDALEPRETFHELVFADPLTGAFNRRHFDHSLPGILNRELARRNKVGVLVFDVDHFKNINDKYGHQAGDDVLIKITSIMKKNSRENDIVYRLGGDEFVLVMVNVTVEIAVTRTEKILNEIMSIKENELITVSIGISISPQHASDINRLFRCADLALYRAKADGRGCARVFDPEIDVVKS